MRHRILAAATLLLGAATAVVAARAQPGFAEVLRPVQLAISIPVPFFGVLERRRLVALGLAAGFALAGVLFAAAATWWAGGDWPAAPRMVALIAGSVVVQLIAQLVGIACGRLIRRPVLAMAATIVVPMTVTVVLQTFAPELVRWLTPYGNALALLAGAANLPSLAVILLLWGVLPNVAARRLGVRPRGR
jgi:hypothetical protein